MIRGGSKRRFPNIKDLYSWISKKKKKQKSFHLTAHLREKPRQRDFLSSPSHSEWCCFYIGDSLAKRSSSRFSIIRKETIQPCIVERFLAGRWSCIGLQCCFQLTLNKGLFPGSLLACLQRGFDFFWLRSTPY